MATTPPTGGPALASVAADPPTTGQAAVPIDAREWRMRTEVRCNAILFAAMFVMTGAYFTAVAWIAITALAVGLAGIVGQWWLRPALPWRAPVRREIDPADLAAIRPVTASFPAMPAQDWADLPVPATVAYAQPPVAVARAERGRPARPTFPRAR